MAVIENLLSDVLCSRERRAHRGVGLRREERSDARSPLQVSLVLNFSIRRQRKEDPSQLSVLRAHR